MSDAIVPARDAATVLLLRDVAGGLEVFMVRRNTVVDFMAGAHVFPGGKVDAADAAPELIARLRGERHSSTAPELYVAAIRETFEEAGVLLAAVDATADLEEARTALAAGTPFVAVLGRLGADLEVARIVPWTRWVTPATSPKRFDATFFLAAAPRGQTARHDEGETTESAWLAPAEALERAQRGALLLAPATYKCLAVLAQHASVAQAFAAARASPPRLWCPVVRMESGRRVLYFSDDPEHPDRYERMPGPTRMVFEGGRYLPA